MDSSSQPPIQIRSGHVAAVETPVVTMLSASRPFFWFSFTYYLPPALLVGQEAPMS
ncbi:MAG TPA: hypothetical protein VGR16_00260 [Thermomicrobiales bacterium]|nr:hypothetical protein [Thermomicrobiales bacterium]